MCRVTTSQWNWSCISLRQEHAEGNLMRRLLQLLESQYNQYLYNENVLNGNVKVVVSWENNLTSRSIAILELSTITHFISRCLPSCDGILAGMYVHFSYCELWHFLKLNLKVKHSFLIHNFTSILTLKTFRFEVHSWPLKQSLSEFIH